MYYLPVHVERRRVQICKLDEDTVTTPQEYILSNSIGNNILAIARKTKLLSEEGTSDDMLVLDRNLDGQWISIFKVKFQREGTGLHIVFEESTDVPGELKVEGQEILHNLGLDYELKGNGLNIKNKKSGPSRIVNCKLIYKEYTCDLVFKMAPLAKIVDSVFDFGSEASQIGIRFHDSESIEFLNLISQTYDHFYKDGLGDAGAKNGDFYQHEPGHNNVLLSYFFLKAQEGVSGTTDKPFKNGKNSLVKILAKHTEPTFFNNINKDTTEGHFLLPNLKLSDAVDFPDIKFEMDDQKWLFDNKEVKDRIFEMIMSQFVHLLLKRINDYYQFKGLTENDKDVFLRLNLLVPNIYSQQKIFNMLGQLNANINDIYQQGFFNVDFQGIELLTISESDASFDYKDYEANISKKAAAAKFNNCLVIDAGKGTTDFSVIKCHNEPKRYISTHRSGIAGAGNLMTYAIVEAIVAIITNNQPQDTREYIKNHILKADAFRKLEFFKLVETIKKRYDDCEDKLTPIPLDGLLEKVYNNNSFAKTEDLNLVNLNVILRKMTEHGERIDDYFGIIQSTVDNYVGRLIKELEVTNTKKFYNIRFAGRAFKFSLLRTKLKNELEKFSKDIRHLESPKLNCLSNSLDKRIKISENSNLVGMPTNSDGVLPWFQNTLGSWGFEEPKPNEEKKEQKDNENFFLSGLNMKRDKLKSIKISGYDYTVTDESILDTEEQELNLIYVGDCFLARSKHQTTKLEIERNRKKTDDDALRSLFPNIPLGESVPFTESLGSTKESESVKYERTVQKYIRILTTP